MSKKIVVHNKKRHILLDEWLSKKNKKKFLLISHCMDRSGAPIALMYMAVFLQEKGYDVIYAARGSGNLTQELDRLDLDYIFLPYELKCDEFYKSLAQGFDCIIVNTIVMSNAVKAIASLNKRIFWWIHESTPSLYNEFYLPIIDSNVTYLAVSNMVIKALKEFAPTAEPRILPYYIPSYQTEKKQKNDIMTFGMIGSGELKGVDVLQKACEVLSHSSAAEFKVKIIMAEEEDKKAFEAQSQLPEQIEIIGELSQSQITDFYSGLDVFVCPSRCDSLPIVVTQALQNSIPCIVSDNVGHCDYFENNFGGFVFKNEDYIAMMHIMSTCIEKPDEVISKKSQALEIYQKYLTKSVFANAIEEIFSSLYL